MSDPEFFQTQMGRRFYEGTLPKLVAEIAKLNEVLERIARQLERLVTEAEKDEQ